MAFYEEQVAALALLLAGEKCPLEREDFVGTWLECYDVIVKAGNFAEAKRRLEETVEDQWRLWEIWNALPENRPPFLSLAELAADLPPIEFLWTGWVPLGLLSLLGADPGVGKSLFALDLARRIILGDVFPDGKPIEDERRRCIYVDAENTPQLLNERADAWRMPKDGLFLMLPEEDEMMCYLDREEEQVRLLEMCRGLDPALVVVDSLGAASSRGENAVEEVREILGFLNKVAADFNTAVVLIHHLSKRNDPFALVRLRDFRGSGHIGAMARSVIGISVVQTSEEATDEAKRLDVVKTNLGLKPKAIGLEISAGGDGAVRLAYGEPPIPYRAATKVEQCAEWIVEVLEEAGGPIKVREVVEMARDEGFPRATVFRARKHLGEKILNTEGRRSPNNQWMLPEQEGKG